jgi:hypothetical protein
MELDAKWCLTICKALDYLSCFCIPKLNNFVESRTKEAFSIVAEANVSHSLAMSHVSPHASPVCKNIPNLYSAIMTG